MPTMCWPAITIVNQLTIARKNATAPSRPVSPPSAERAIGVSGGETEPDSADENDVRDGENQPERRGQPIAAAISGSTLTDTG